MSPLNITVDSSHKYRVDAHVRVFHEGIKLHCNLCEYTAVSKKMIKIHTEKKHDGIRYQCDLCENKYTMNKGLQDHSWNVQQMAGKDFDAAKEVC